MRPFFLGIDCGGSTCRALAVDAKGTVLHRGQAGAANLATTPQSLLKRHLQGALVDCPAPDYVCGCFAGLLTKEDRIRATGIIGALFPSAKVRVEPDYFAALEASPEGTDICVISGTGSVVCSRKGHSVAKSGGRGFVLGDYGSAYRYGREFLRRRMETDTLNQLAQPLEREFGSPEEADILCVLYRKGPIATRLAKLAKYFVGDVRSGEPYALDFLREESLRLAEIVVSHAEKHCPRDRSLKIGLTGGLWRIASMFEIELIARLNDLSGGRKFERTKIKKAPVEGAVKLARELCNEHRIS